MQKEEASLLIVDDDPEIIRSLRLFLSRFFTAIEAAQDPGEINSMLQEHDIHVVLLDMNFSRGMRSGEEGLRWLKHIRETSPQTEVVMITAYGDLELAIRTIKEGAHDFILKPWTNDKLLSTVKAAVRQNKSNRALVELKTAQKQLLGEQRHSRKMIRSCSEAVNRMYELVRKVAPTDASVLLSGENGCGKEIVAEMIHEQSARSEQVMIRIDLGSISESLFESELFGHMKGAFTDAREDRIGKLEMANGGTLFLDEIGNLPLHLQAKLLSVIQDRKVVRIGSLKEKEVDFRLICATNRDLKQMVKNGTFREDLLYRIHTVEIQVPPLRQRVEDIPLFLDHYIRYYTGRYQKKEFSYDESLLRHLARHSWPGNIRELKHAVERAVILADGRRLSRKDFHLFPLSGTAVNPSGETLTDVEKERIVGALAKNRGNISRAASELGISRFTLYRKMKKYEI